jgi:hypothetical protein
LLKVKIFNSTRQLQERTPINRISPGAGSNQRTKGRIEREQPPAAEKVEPPNYIKNIGTGIWLPLPVPKRADLETSCF